jgi:hypothetical protein
VVKYVQRQLIYVDPVILHYCWAGYCFSLFFSQTIDRLDTKRKEKKNGTTDPWMRKHKLQCQSDTWCTQFIAASFQVSMRVSLQWISTQISVSKRFYSLGNLLFFFFLLYKG